MKDIRLNFTGYYRTNNLIPEKSGIYIAHARRKSDRQLVQLVYIGKAEGTNNLKKRIQEHIDGTDSKQCNRVWIAKLKASGIDYVEIVYSYAECEELNLDNIETALIYANEDNGIFNKRDTHGHNNQDANNLNVFCFGDKGKLKNHIIEIK